jgi:hypothetical protein
MSATLPLLVKEGDGHLAEGVCYGIRKGTADPCSFIARTKPDVEMDCRASPTDSPGLPYDLTA